MSATEKWKEIKNYENIYLVSNLGNIYSKYKNRKLKPHKSKNGYLYVALNKNKKMKYCTVHRLVAQAFISNPNNLPCINHKDENKLNNNVNNLEWCTMKYNNTYGSKILKLGDKKVLQYDLNGKLINSYKSMHEANRQTGIDYRNISAVCNKKRKTTGGYIWEFADEEVANV